MSDSAFSLAQFYCLRHLFGESVLAQPDTLSLVQEAIQEYLALSGVEQPSIQDFVTAVLQLQICEVDEDNSRGIKLLDVSDFGDQPLFLRTELMRLLPSFGACCNKLLIVCGFRSFSQSRKQSMIAYIDAVCADFCDAEDTFHILYLPL